MSPTKSTFLPTGSRGVSGGTVVSSATSVCNTAGEFMGRECMVFLCLCGFYLGSLSH